MESRGSGILNKVLLDALIPLDIRCWLLAANHNTQFILNWMHESERSRTSQRAYETSQHSSEQYGTFVEPHLSPNCIFELTIIYS